MADTCCRSAKEADVGGGRQDGLRSRASRPAVASRVPALIGALACIPLLRALPAAAQQAWEYAPYAIQVWVEVAEAPQLPPVVSQRIRRTIAERAEIEVGASWVTSVETAPRGISPAVVIRSHELPIEAVEQYAAKSLTKDKLMFLSVEADPRTYRVSARELDCRTRIWGPVVRREVRNEAMLAPAAFRAVREAFTPLTRIEEGEARTAVVRLRAGGLIVDQASPCSLTRGAILRPILRNIDRNGKPIPGRVNEIPWTLLRVTDHDVQNPNLLQCEVFSGIRSPIRGRSTARRERYALSVRPTEESTQVVVEAVFRQRGEPAERLAGLEIFERDVVAAVKPDSGKASAKDEERTNPPRLLGYTDWKGSIAVPRGETPLRMLYIKNGGQLLARLPLAPGLHPVQTAQVPDDNPRLQAEGYIKGLNGAIMDLVAQRQILAALIRKRIGERQFGEAEKLLEKLGTLKTRGDMQRALDDQLARQRESPYKSVQDRINKLYSDVRSLLAKQLDPSLGSQLQRELQLARQGGVGP